MSRAQLGHHPIAVIIATHHSTPRSGSGYSDLRYLPAAIDSVWNQRDVMAEPVVVYSAAEPIAEIEELGPVSAAHTFRIDGDSSGRSSRYIDAGVCHSITAAVRLLAAECPDPPDWIVPLNADDELAPHFVAECLASARLARPRAEIVLLSDSVLSPAILRDNYVTYCCMARAEFWLEHGMRRVEAIADGGPTDPLADWDMWMRLWELYGGAAEAPIAYASPALLRRRERPDSASKWSSTRFEQIRGQLWKQHGVEPETGAGAAL